MSSIKQENKAVTQNDVAKAAGVTRSMVSYVINGNTDRSVAPETRERILSVIEELGYRPNKAAQALQLGDVAFAEKNIGLVIPNGEIFLRPYYSEIIAGIHTAAHANGYTIKFIRFFDELKNPVLFNEIIHPESIGSLILLALNQAITTGDDIKIIEKIKTQIEDIVCLEWKYEGLSSVGFDRQETAKKATEYLINKQYDDIIYIGEKDERIFGVQQALLQHNLNAVMNNFYLAESFSMEGGYQAMFSIAKKRKLPQAIVCGSDEVAVGVIRYLNEQKIAIPEQVALISIDNIEISAFTNPPLTTMHVKKKLMGQKAVEMIKNKAFGQGDNAVCVNLPVEVIERKSC